MMYHEVMKRLSVALALAVFAAAAVKADKLDDLTRMSREGSAKGSLGSLRSGLAIYYGDTEGNYPANLSALVPKYIKEVPALELPEHKKTNKVVIVKKAKGKSVEPYLKDTGGWLYFSGSKTGELEGTLVIDCKHKEYKGRPLSGF